MSLLIVAVIYRSVSILVGLAFAIMGYRLFMVGVFEKAGDLKVAWGEGKSLLLKQAAPGTFFALFGTAIVCLSVWRGISVAESLPDGRPGISAVLGGENPVVSLEEQKGGQASSSSNGNENKPAGGGGGVAGGPGSGRGGLRVDLAPIK